MCDLAVKCEIITPSLIRYRGKVNFHSHSSHLELTEITSLFGISLTLPKKRFQEGNMANRREAQMFDGSITVVYHPGGSNAETSQTMTVLTSTYLLS